MMWWAFFMGFLLGYIAGAALMVASVNRAKRNNEAKRLIRKLKREEQAKAYAALYKAGWFKPGVDKPE